jgi:hypothetical protein
MRTIRVQENRSSHIWLWLAAGAAAGLTVGILVAERRSGRKTSFRKFVARGRGLASGVIDNIGPILETAMSLREAWSGPVAEDEEEEVEEVEELDEELDDEELDEDDLDDEEDEDDELDEEDNDADEADDDEDEEEDEEEDDEDEADEDEEPELSGLDARVLEAFSNDPILADRAVEIEDVGTGDIVLHGRVRNPSEVKHAVTMARGVPGVTRVREKLKVYSRR